MKSVAVAALVFAASLGTAQAQDRVTVGDIVIPNGAGSTVLFNGVTPKHGFLIALAVNNGTFCNISDNGPAVGYEGFLLGVLNASNATSNAPFFAVPMFVTPPGYTPVGPVSVSCNRGGDVLTARMW